MIEAINIYVSTYALLRMNCTIISQRRVLNLAATKNRGENYRPTLQRSVIGKAGDPLQYAANCQWAIMISLRSNVVLSFRDSVVLL